MKKFAIFGLSALFAVPAMAQRQKRQPQQSTQLERPKLVVGLVVDQMRWDFLYRYYNQYGSGGFKRLLNDGFALHNTHINYVPTVTALGHTCVYTGSVPSIHGIAGNDWFDRTTGKGVYCTTDEGVNPVGTDDRKIGSHSPKNLWSTTISDELRLATNFQAKVVGVSLKDRASILPAGHNPTGAYWFDGNTGNFVTSSYYTHQLPQWVSNFNSLKLGEQLLAGGWNTLYPISEYTQSSADNVEWEGLLGSAKAPVFPYNNLAEDYRKNPDVIRSTPYGNTLSLKIAEAAIEGENLGKDAVTDMLAINLASTDYVGHKFGPNSVEIQDTYLRLDRDLEEFFNYLDKNVGKGQYTVFLTADHGAAHSVGFLQQHKIKTGYFGEGAQREYNTRMKSKYGVDNLLTSITNYQIYLSDELVEKNKMDMNNTVDYLVDQLNKDQSILYAVNMKKIATAPIPEPIKTRMINGYNWQRSGDIQLVSHDSMLPSGLKKGTTHSVWNPYDAHIPLIFMGWGIPRGESNAPYDMTDIAPTISALLKIQFPSGNIGKPITEIVK